MKNTHTRIIRRSLAVAAVAAGLLAGAAHASAPGFDARMSALVAHVKADPNYKIVEEYDTGESYGFAFAKGEKAELLDAINGALAELRDSGEYDTIYDSYFSAN